jgi:hypothetical protein
MPILGNYRRFFLVSFISSFFALVAFNEIAQPAPLPNLGGDRQQIADQGFCYAVYSSPNGYKMYTLNVGEKSIEGCRKFSWMPFRVTFFAKCPKCKVIQEEFLGRLGNQLEMIAAKKPAGWPYEIKGSLRMWFGGQISRETALHACRQDANSWIAQHLGSKLSCIE